jgi:hypothetical protein
MILNVGTTSVRKEYGSFMPTRKAAAHYDDLAEKRE